MEFNHVSVLLDECIDNLNIKEDGVYVDCTMGGAGHSKEIVKRLSKDGLFIGFDQDKNAIATAKERLAEYSDRVRFVHSNFSNIKEELESQQITLKKVKIIDTVSEYATIDRIDGMLSLASEIGLMNNKKIKKLNIMKMENEKMISKHEK